MFRRTHRDAPAGSGQRPATTAGSRARQSSSPYYARKLLTRAGTRSKTCFTSSMLRVAIPDDSPPVLANSAAWAGLKQRAQLDYHDTLPFSENVLIERIRDAEAVLNIRSSSLFTERVFAACPKLRLLSVWGTGTDHVDLGAAARFGVTVTNTPGVSAISIAEHALP